MNRPSWSDATRRLAGIFTVVLLIAVAGGGGALIDHALHHLLGVWAWPVIAILAAPGLAQRSLFDHVRPVASALEAGIFPPHARRSV